MSLATDIAGVMAEARTFLTGTNGLVNVLWNEGSGQPHSVVGVHSGPKTADPKGSLYGEIAGVRGDVRIVLADCDPWTPPQADDSITLTTAANVEIGVYTVLAHRDDQANVTRLLQYGEAAA